MKHMNIVVSVIIAGAVLVAAYAVGLLVRHMRTPDGRLESAAVAPTEDPAALKARVAQQSPGGRNASGADSNLPAEVQRQREQMLEKMKNMTEEEKRRFVEQEVRNRFSAADGRGGSRKISPEEREKMLQKWKSLSEGQKRAFDARAAEPEPAPEGPPQAPANAGSATTQQSPQPGGSEPNKAGQE